MKNMKNEGRICTVYRCSRKQELYVYMDKQAAPEELPEALRQDLGRLEPVMTLLLSPRRKLARADSGQVLEAIASQGFYLQMPPADPILGVGRAPAGEKS